jgi:hypothetical protein
VVAEAEPLETELLDRVTPLPQTHPKETTEEPPRAQMEVLVVEVLVR